MTQLVFNAIYFFNYMLSSKVLIILLWFVNIKNRKVDVKSKLVDALFEFQPIPAFPVAIGFTVQNGNSYISNIQFSNRVNSNSLC